MSPQNFDCSINASSERDLFDQIREITSEIRPNWNPKRLEFNKFTNGITNTVLSVQDPKDDEKLVFRIYGNCTETIIDRKSELESFELLNKFDIAPPIFARFKNGFAVGHLPGETLTISNVRDPSIIPKVCEKLAILHKIQVKRPKSPFLFTKSQQFLDNIPERFEDNAKQKVYEKCFLDVDFKSMFNDLQAMTSNAKQKNQVLCHNDLLINNILFDSEKDEAHIIDYEYMAVNYQLFDIANHFNEWAGVENVNFDLCPNDEEKRDFLKIYLTHYLERDPTNDEVEDILAEIPIFEAASHAFWTFWALVQANNSTIDFDYLDYAFQRHTQYLKTMGSIKKTNHH